MRRKFVECIVVCLLASHCCFFRDERLGSVGWDCCAWCSVFSSMCASVSSVCTCACTVLGVTVCVNRVSVIVVMFFVELSFCVCVWADLVVVVVPLAVVFGGMFRVLAFIMGGATCAC